MCDGCGASSRNRTGTAVKLANFKSAVSTDFTIEACNTLCLAAGLKGITSEVELTGHEVSIDQR